MSITNGGLPSTNNYQIGRGILRLDLFDTAGNATGQYRDLGNVTAFALNLEEETLDHEASMSGLKTLDASVTLSKSLKGSLTLDEITSENQLLFFSGTHVERAQASLSFTGATSNVTCWVVPRNSAGYWMPIYYDNGGSPRFDLKGTKERGFKVTITRVDISGGASDLVRGTDWDYDSEAGLFVALAGGALDSGSDINVELDISFAALTGATTNNKLREVRPLLRTVVRGRLSFIGENAQTGEKYEVFLNRVKLQADGDAQMIGDEFSELTLALTAEADTAYDSVAPTGRIIRIPTVTG